MSNNVEKIGFWIRFSFPLKLFFPPVTHSPFHQVEIASMQTVSIETLKHQDTRTFRRTGGLRDRENRTGLHDWKKTDQGIRTVVNALSNASVSNITEIFCLLMTYLFVSPNVAARNLFLLWLLSENTEFVADCAPFP